MLFRLRIHRRKLHDCCDHCCQRSSKTMCWSVRLMTLAMWPMPPKRYARRWFRWWYMLMFTIRHWKTVSQFTKPTMNFEFQHSWRQARTEEIFYSTVWRCSAQKPVAMKPFWWPASVRARKSQLPTMIKLWWIFSKNYCLTSRTLPFNYNSCTRSIKWSMPQCRLVDFLTFDIDFISFD